MPTTEQVYLEYSMKDEATRSMEGLAKASEKVAHKGERVSEGFNRMGEGADRLTEHLGELTAAFGLGLGMKATIEKFVDVNAEAESLQKRLGALVAAKYQYGNLGAVDNFNQAMKTSGELFATFQKASTQYGISLGGLGEAMSEIAPAYAHAGVSSKKAAEDIIQLGRLSNLTGESLDSTARTLNMFLQTGGVIHRNPIFGLLGITKMPEESFTPEQRAKKLNELINKFNLDATSGVKTFGGAMNIARATIEEMMREAGKPTFEAAKKALQSINAYLGQNKARLIEVGKLVGEKFVTGLEYAGIAAKFVADHAEEIYRTAQALVALKLGEKLFGGASGALQSMGGELSKLNYLAGKSAFAATQGSGGGFGLLDGVAQQGTAFGKLAAVSMLAGAAFFGYEVGTAINAWLQKQDWWNRLMTPGKSAAEEAADKKVSDLRAFEDNIQKSIGLTVQARITKGQAGTETEAVAKMISQARKGEFVGSSVGRFSESALLKWAAKRGFVQEGPEPSQKSMSDLERAKAPYYDFRGSRFDILQKFAEGFDPDRVAVAMMSDLQTAGDRKTQSNGFAPIFSTR